MYLKSIEVQGFKSFANKINFEFHNGITCIVGPNGSGKSNVADAVRWVLGEQSAKQLRGSSMQDVIFAGTELRKPQSYAYVAITLDNSDHSLNIDYKEVTVARRVYRSGESEYLINGNNCRLRDVQELFYDTGIGKEGYSIIGQGQIDKILSSKPEDRRELFDEAAGIVKYKRRKNQALKKLENEHQDLVRVKDILGELEKQVGPLERQSKAAREYLRLKESLKYYEINAFRMDYADSESRMKDLDGRIAIVDADIAVCEAETAELRTQYEQIEAEIDELNSLIEEERTEQNDARLEKQQKEGQAAVLTEQIASGKQMDENLRARIRAREEELAAKREELAGIAEDLTAKEAELASARAKAEEAGAKLAGKNEEIRSLTEGVDDQNRLMLERLENKSSYAAELQKYRMILDQNKQRKAELVRDLVRYGADEQSFKKRYEELAGVFRELRKQLEDVRDEQEQAQNALMVIRNTEQRLAQSLSRAQQDYHAFHTKAEQIRNLAERYEGYGGSIRRIMEVKAEYPGIRGVVADLVKVPQKYEIAIETALGGSIQNIVTDTERTAKELVSYLKQNRYGRATFLPMDGIVADREFAQKGALKEKGVLGLASDLVTVSREYQKLAVYLLGRVLVVDTIDNALAVARKYHHSIRIVTLEGELLSAGGSITGGAFKNNSNLLGRTREIEELEAKAKHALATYDKLLAEQKEAQDSRRETEAELTALSGRMQQLAVEENTARIRAEQAKKDLEAVTGDRDAARKESSEIEAQIEKIREREKEVHTDIENLDRENTDSEESIVRMNATLETLRAERETLEKEASGEHIRVEACSQTLHFAQENHARVEEELARLTEDVDSMNAELSQDAADITARSEAIAGLLAAAEDLGKRIEELDDIIRKDMKRRDQKNEVNRGFFVKREELTDRGSRLDKEQYRLRGQKEKLEEHIHSIVEYLWEEYELMPSEAEGQVAAFDGTLADAKKETSALKTQIRALGNVNVNAIEEYKEVLERYTFMNSQYEDLQKAEDALQQIIDDLEAGMQAQFREQFGRIQKEFDRVFRDLFGGGKGTLELTEDEEDITEAGIRIIAQPPGKKLQNMMQLSGGEKALTAIALLFAIQELKPSPFALLDEIEAALDDANVGRFADYLKKLTDRTQFILISHRRGTMNNADRLYGITMQEKGVSALVSVNLVEQELDQ